MQSTEKEKVLSAREETRGKKPLNGSEWPMASGRVSSGVVSVSLERAHVEIDLFLFTRRYKMSQIYGLFLVAGHFNTPAVKRVVVAY